MSFGDMTSPLRPFPGAVDSVRGQKAAHLLRFQTEQLSFDGLDSLVQNCPVSLGAGEFFGVRQRPFSEQVFCARNCRALYADMPAGQGRFLPAAFTKAARAQAHPPVMKSSLGAHRCHGTDEISVSVKRRRSTGWKAFLCKNSYSPRDGAARSASSANRFRQSSDCSGVHWNW